MVCDAGFGNILQTFEFALSFAKTKISTGSEKAIPQPFLLPFRIYEPIFGASNLSFVSGGENDLYKVGSRSTAELGTLPTGSKPTIT